MKLAHIPAGSFLMGSTDADPTADPEEFPQHEVTIGKSFEIGVTEVTLGQFRRFMVDTGYVTEAEEDPLGGWVIQPTTREPKQVKGANWRACGFEQDDDHPVILVSWVDAEEFCAWLSRKEGRTYRLPTEAEWEYACRAGTTTRYWFGDDPSGLVEVANVADQSLRGVVAKMPSLAPWRDGFPFTAPVGQFRPNPAGLQDVYGNVWEWCADWHDPEYYARSPKKNPKGPDSGEMRVIRGGGWYDGPARQRSAQRAWFFPVFRYCQLSGFRVVREIES
ncbi:MAG: formylglycine-generating enzyme family protein [Candidatus Eisenbacteria bacterium]|uniref:Formylglycine-generating enzyme family protein n=1 Tax=Eiseniibacteriota bacterium TaxID=2212470 RepID=A0A956N9K1_UNCEI|nr:formylglycine-generating enzyme family protein [Candidatus Eisenbacteria bacterium]MCB9464776.1 formylglycine-generating enzyme family protein [Candidatus Eisenbacteria bacterium]